MSLPEAAILFSCMILALYSGIRLGYFAPKSTAALEDAMGVASRVEKLCLLLGTAALFLAFLWRIP
ncbi:MAG TPA: hypothetical protein VKM72_35900 [Thermoanaerobaculia bacterium]|nr:hypothetical protein [Thermoanaerobaculia bacterium]